ncbi:hypothetical protein F0562_000567 [Nyssa sinensis]|uniref:Uncharacterized protein n=1 Tax=Nyssa sinensis TaxID=561372 RepID=A0A5J5C0F1_9ASTE|nr:hypothetical protein F0562_000567 [Nyssa sinensis]
MLHSAPSFSIYDSKDGFEEDERALESEMLESDGCLVRSVTIGDSIEALGSAEFSFGKKAMGLIEEDGEDEEEEALNGIQNLGIEESGQPVSSPLYLVTGFGIDDPCNPLFLRNYAQLLQSKGDLLGAEEYYFRATLADPQDGEILLQYAKLVWELHHDRDRALSYFNRAAQAAAKDSHVLAAYASFLWEIEDEEEDCPQTDHTEIKEDKNLVELQNSALEEEKKPQTLARMAILRSITRRWFKKILATPYFSEIMPSSSIGPRETFREPRNTTHVPYLADPGDGETISQYAKLVWELHRDRDKATCYFEQAVQAAPGDSHVLAAYASFLWETEEDEEEHSAQQDHIQVPLFYGQAMISMSS